MLRVLVLEGFALCFALTQSACFEDSGSGASGTPSGTTSTTSTTSTTTTAATTLTTVLPTSTTEDGADSESGEPTGNTSAPRCGDAVVDVGEDCDDGNDENTDGCSTLCRFPGAMLWLTQFPAGTIGNGPFLQTLVLTPAGLLRSYASSRLGRGLRCGRWSYPYPDL